MDHEFLAAVDAQHEDFEETAGGVESQAQVPSGAVVVEVADEDGMLGGIDRVLLGDAVLACGSVDLHAT